ncbi:hypothetical protein ACHAXA_008509 [Cyclostephanos tholiformis]|uniref:BZIP domain-containing protein n=1 Tax=Cyclostephanos tholiformis TaxID=382380 RepID=A0ABD3RS09_9STRA
MAEDGDDKSSMHRYYHAVGVGATPNPLASYDATSPDMVTTTNAGYYYPPLPRHHDDASPCAGAVPDPFSSTNAMTSPTTSPTTAATSAWTRGGGPGSIGPASTTIPPAPSPLASPVLSPLVPPTPIGDIISSLFEGANGNDDVGRGNDDDSAATSESVKNAMASAMLIDGITTSTPTVGAVVVDNVGVAGMDISQPVLGMEGGGGGVGKFDFDDKYVDYEPPTNRRRRRRSYTMHRDDPAHRSSSSTIDQYAPPPPPPQHSLRSSATAVLQSAASAAVFASSSLSSSSHPPVEGGYRDPSPHHHRSSPPPAGGGTILPPSRLVSSASVPLFGVRRGGAIGYSHSSESIHSELNSEGGYSESDAGSPPAGATFVAGGGGGGGGGGIASGATTTTTTTTTTTANTAHVSFASASVDDSSSPTGGGGKTIIDKRQRRLERNRESARVSRRRRKHYLEELECRVTALSEEMDAGRMAHASAAARTIRGMRSGALDDVEGLLMSMSSSSRWGNGTMEGDVYHRTTGAGPPPPVKKSSGIHHNVMVAKVADDHHHSPIGGGCGSIITQLTAPATAVTATSTSSLEHTANALITNLSRASVELQVVQTFMKQHLLSLVQPTSTRFILWLSLQNDVFYRGGRSASERLSAARIGERLLHSGTDRALPNTTVMWPLVCHEISLSYEQEEKVRGVQRTILSNAEGWIHRHTALATRYVIEGVHDVICGAQAAARSKERSLMQILTPEQRLRFLRWASRRADVKRLVEMNAGRFRGERTTVNCGDDEYRTSPDRHISANLYIINHILSKVKQRQQQRQQELGTPATLAFAVHPTKLKKLSRRPALESLAGLQAAEDAHDAKLSRERSFPSAGSLKRSLSSLTSLADDSHTDSIDPNAMNFSNGGSNSVTLESAQSAGQAAVMALLRDVLPIVPKEAWCNPPQNSSVGSTFRPPTLETSQPLPMPQTYRPLSHAHTPSSVHIPKSSQHAKQPERCTSSHSHRMQQAASSSKAGIAAQPQFKESFISDIIDVDDIPMPTPVSVLLRTSDDYLMSSSEYEQVEEPQADTVMSSSSDFRFGAADGFSMPERTGYSSFVNTNAGLYRPQSAPQLEAFAQATDFQAYHHMTMIPEMEAVMSHPGVSPGNHGATDFAIPEEINSSYSYVASTGLLGNRHQSAPQFGTFFRSSELHPDPLLQTAPDVSVMPDIAYKIPGGDDIIGEFAMLDELNFINPKSNVETDDWAIGEGFDDDIDVGAS